MAEQFQENNKDLHQNPPENQPGNELEAAGKSLSEALRISFITLKVLMIFLVVLFLISGFKTVASDERALVLRFGKIRGIGENRILEPGLIGPLPWLNSVFPYPIDKVVKIPVGKKTNLPINSFWYYQDPLETIPEGPRGQRRPGPTLKPLRDGYCITRGEKPGKSLTGTAGGDYNIVHCKWQVIYQINDPERFFKNVYVEDVKPGDIYFDVIKKGLKPLLESILADAVVTTMVNYTIDEARSSDERIARDVQKLLRANLNKIESGIEVIEVQLTDVTWPRQVDAAFQASIRASQTRQKAISEAKLYAEKTLNEAAGSVAKKHADARAYRTKIVETARANAKYFEQLLPEYRKRPRLVIQEIYQEAIEDVLDNADEKIIIQPTEGTKVREMRVLINRDPTIKPKTKKNKNDGN